MQCRRTQVPLQDSLASSDDKRVPWLDFHHTFTLVDKLPEGRKAITKWWVFRWDLNGHNGVILAESRMVLETFIQEFGVDYFNIDAPTLTAT